MDAIALLCTLHADGPATVKRLRRAGCGSLSELLAFDVERLAAILGAPPAVARRFQREAKSLSERQGEIWHEREETLPPARLPADEAVEAPADGTPVLHGREQRILDEVLATWRLRDAEQPSAPRDGVEPTAGPGAIAADGRYEPGELRELRPRIVDGLDAEACARLVAAGVADLDALARVDPVAVARAAGLGFTRVARWRALADRAARAGRDRRAERAAGASNAACGVETILGHEPPVAPRARVDTVASERRFSPSALPPVDTARGLELELVASNEAQVATCAGPFA